MRRPVATISRSAIALVTVSLPQAGCLMQTITTEVTFHDPSAVALSANGAPVIPAGVAGPSVQKLASGRAEIGDSSSAAYDVAARREPDKSLWVDWTTALPLANGETQKVLGAEPLTFSKPLTDLFSESTLHAPSFVFPMCTRAYVHTSYGRGTQSSQWLVDGRSVGDDCSGPAVVPYQLETPWSNVAIHEMTRVQHGIGWLVVALATLGFTPFAVIIDTASPKNISGGVPTQVGFTIALAAIALAFDGAMVPTLVTPDRDVYYQR